jgi:hypothetical protein
LASQPLSQTELTCPTESLGTEGDLNSTLVTLYRRWFCRMRTRASCPKMLVAQSPSKVHLLPCVIFRFHQVTIVLSPLPSMLAPRDKTIALCPSRLHTLAGRTVPSPAPPRRCASRAHRAPHARSQLRAALPPVNPRPLAPRAASLPPTLMRAQPHFPLRHARKKLLPSHLALQGPTQSPASARSLIFQMC